MASISLDLKVSIEGAHAINGNMLHIRIVRDIWLLWTGMSIYDDFSEHGLDAHSRWVGSSWLADCGLYTRHSDVEQIGVLEESSIPVVS